MRDSLESEILKSSGSGYESSIAGSNCGISHAETRRVHTDDGGTFLNRSSRLDLLVRGIDL